MKKIIAWVIILLVVPSPLVAGCYLQSETKTELIGVIGGIRNVNVNLSDSPKIKPFVECVVSMEVKIRGEWKRTLGSTIIDDNESKNVACDRALEVAKKNALKWYVPERLESKSTMNCDSRGGEYRSVDTFTGRLPWLTE